MIARTIPSTIPLRKSGWGVPVALIALCAVPLIMGARRLVTLAGVAEIMPGNARLSASPLPVVLHIVNAGVFAGLGAFQFAALAAGQAAAVAHGAAHELGAAAYAIRAVRAAAPENEREEAGRLECQWQRAQTRR